MSVELCVAQEEPKSEERSQDAEAGPEHTESSSEDAAALFEWLPIGRGDLLPDGVIKSGTTTSDGDVYVCRDDKEELGKLNVNRSSDGLSMHNIWCPNSGQSTQGQVLTLVHGSVAEWKAIRRGELLPPGVVRGGCTELDGDIYVARTQDGQCGKLTVSIDKESGLPRAQNIYVHNAWFTATYGEVLCIHGDTGAPRMSF